VENNSGTSAKAAGGSVHQTETPKYVPYLMLSCLLSGIAVALVIGLMVFVPMLIDARVEARMAELRQVTTQQLMDTRLAIAQQVADAKATSAAGTQHARIALDKVELLQIQLGQKKFINTADH
jgi:hypothetical protein